MTPIAAKPGAPPSPIRWFKVGYSVSTVFYSFCLLSTVLPVTSIQLAAQQLTISRPGTPYRLPEVIEIPLQQVKDHIPDLDRKTAENAQTHEKLPTQVYTDPDNPSSALYLIAIQLPVNGVLPIDFVPTTEPPAPLVFGREAPERKDDFAWENQLVAYRVYGPALEATGEIASGIDVWSKRVPNFVIDSFYKRDAEGARTHNPALSYHNDDGIGLDSYQVGPTRGCGGTAIYAAGKLWVSKNYTHLKQLATGPVRFQFELTYAPWNANGIEVTEIKRITLDAGSHLNKIDSTFTFHGPQPPKKTDTIDTAAGLAIHPDAGVEQLANGKILSIWDTPQDPTAGRIATGLIVAPGQQSIATELDNQALLVFKIHSGETISYYAGSAWSKADMPTLQTWDRYLQKIIPQLQRPLSIRWEDPKSTN